MCGLCSVEIRFIPGCRGVDVAVIFCKGSAVSGIRQMGFELDLGVWIGRI